MKTEKEIIAEFYSDIDSGSESEETSSDDGDVRNEILKIKATLSDANLIARLRRQAQEADYATCELDNTSSYDSIEAQRVMLSEEGNRLITSSESSSIDSDVEPIISVPKETQLRLTDEELRVLHDNNAESLLNWKNQATILSNYLQSILPPSLAVLGAISYFEEICRTDVGYIEKEEGVRVLRKKVIDYLDCVKSHAPCAFIVNKTDNAKLDITNSLTALTKVIRYSEEFFSVFEGYSNDQLIKFFSLKLVLPDVDLSAVDESLANEYITNLIGLFELAVFQKALVFSHLSIQLRLPCINLSGVGSSIAESYIQNIGRLGDLGSLGELEDSPLCH